MLTTATKVDLSAEDFAKQAYIRILGRNIDDPALSNIIEQLDSRRNRSDILCGLVSSEEFRNRLLKTPPSLGYQISGGLNEGPVYLQVESTKRCNHNCSYCTRTFFNRESNMITGDFPKELWPEIFRFGSKVGYVRFHGFGEPLLYPDLLSNMSAFDEAGVSTGFSTNGIALPGFVKDLAKLNNLLHINVSVDSPDPAVYKKIRGGDFSHLYSALRLLTQHLPNTNISVSTVFTRLMLPTLCDFPEFLSNVKIRNLIVQDLNDPQGRCEDLRVQWHAEVDEAFEKLEQDCDTRGIVLNIGPTLELERAAWSEGTMPMGESANTRQCNWPFDSLYVDVTGKVFPCCLAVEGASIGNMYEQTLDEIWHGAALHRFQQQMLSDNGPEICRKCRNAPPGLHPLSRYGASVVSLIAAGQNPLKVQLRLRNTGMAPWGEPKKVTIGTTRPRDRQSTGAISDWLSPNRPAGIRESLVRPGEIATFNFGIDTQANLKKEFFQVVIEGETWLPGSEFFIDFSRKVAGENDAFITCLIP